MISSIVKSRKFNEHKVNATPVSMTPVISRIICFLPVFFPQMFSYPVQKAA